MSCGRWGLGALALGGGVALGIALWRLHQRLVAMHLDIQTLLAHVVDADEPIPWGDEDGAWELTPMQEEEADHDR